MGSGGLSGNLLEMKVIAETVGQLILLLLRLLTCSSWWTNYKTLFKSCCVLKRFSELDAFQPTKRHTYRVWFKVEEAISLDEVVASNSGS